MRFLLGSVLWLVTFGACSPTAPAPNVEATVSAAVSATVRAVATRAPTSTPVETVDLARSRSGLALAVWPGPGEAYLAQYPHLTFGLPRCTVPPYADVRVVGRDSGFRFTALSTSDQATVRNETFLTGLAPDTVAQVASTDQRCVGYVAASLLTDPGTH